MSETKAKNTFISNNEYDKAGQIKQESATTVNVDSNKGRIVAYTHGFKVIILPPELWELIFKKVPCPKDLLSCWNTTSAWTNALRSTDFYFKMALPFMLPYLSQKDLLNCSSVSKCWNTSVDTCIQLAEDFGSDSRLNERQRFNLTLRLNTISLPGFIKHFGLSTENECRGKIASVMNPINFRRVEVHVYTLFLDNEDECNWISIRQRAIIKCLDHIGHLIRHLNLVIYDTEPFSFFDLIILIQNCLKRTPNVSVFRIDASTTPDEDKGDVEAFNAFISENPWPPLKYLKVLKFNKDNKREEFASLANAYARQLVYLQFGFKLVELHHPLSNRFSCLQKIVCFFSNSLSEMEFAAFIQSNRCPLKQLSIEFSSDVENINGLIIAANAASATLKTLEFSRPRMVFRKEEDFDFDIAIFGQLRLPKLKVLRLGRFGYPSLEFLKSVCPALQQLTLEPSFTGEDDEMGDSRRMYCDLYSCYHFWNEVAEIQYVSVKHKLNSQSLKVKQVYTRRGYEAQD